MVRACVCMDAAVYIALFVEGALLTNRGNRLKRFMSLYQSWVTQKQWQADEML